MRRQLQQHIDGAGAQALARALQLQHEAAQALISDLRGCASQIRSDVKNTQRALIQHDQPTSLVFEVENGVIGELRMVEPRPLAA